MFNSGYIFRDQKNILERGNGTMVMVLSPYEEPILNETAETVKNEDPSIEVEGPVEQFNCIEIPPEDEEFTPEIFQASIEELELLTYQSNIHRLIRG